MPISGDLPEYDTFLPILIKIILVIFLLYLISLVVTNYFGLLRTCPVLISNPTSTMEPISFQSSKLPLSEIDKGLSWTLINWLYIEDWNYRYGQKKMIIDWGNNLQMYFEEKSNDLVIEITTVPLMKRQRLIQKDIPLQRWMCLILVLDNRQLDLFMDNILVQSIQLDYVPFYLQEELNLFSHGGFRGKCGYLQYLSYRIPQFGINHFQQIEKKLNNSSILYSFYNSFIFSILFGFKQTFSNMLIILDRRFKNINTLSVDLVSSIFKWIKDFITGMIGYITHLISR
jgi:hypothetical protein